VPHLQQKIPTPKIICPEPRPIYTKKQKIKKFRGASRHYTNFRATTPIFAPRHQFLRYYTNFRATTPIFAPRHQLFENINFTVRQTQGRVGFKQGISMKFSKGYV